MVAATASDKERSRSGVRLFEPALCEAGEIAADLAEAEHGAVACVAKHYGAKFASAGNDAENRACFRADGWFRTGDLVILDHDDNVTMTGRVKDIINRGGIKINPIDIEALIDEHSDGHCQTNAN